MTRSTQSPQRGALAAVSLAAVLCSSDALAASKEREARALEERAMATDYPAKQFKSAEQKLQKALKACGKEQCGKGLRAELHLDLAAVYIVGLKKQGNGKKELRAALAADPQVALKPNLRSPELEQAYVAAGGVAAEQQAPADSGKRDGSEPEAATPDPQASQPEPADSRPADATPRNWFSLHFQQDFLSYKQTAGVCSGAAEYECLLQGQAFKGPAYAGSGNQLKAGVGLATRRVLVGYERLVGDNVTLGARLGFAFGGHPQAANGTGGAFVPFHAEARGSYWFGSRPFASAGARGYVGLALGFGEVDGPVAVEYYPDDAAHQQGTKGELQAWRKTGKALLGLHAGFAYAFSRGQQLSLEVRALQLLGESALGGAANVGYAFGL